MIRLETSRGERISKTVIVTAGVGAFEPKRIEAPGVRELEGRGVHYFAKRVEDFRDKDVVIVGGGDSAVDWALTLEPVARHVTLIHRSKFRAHETSVRDLEASSVDLRYPGCECVQVHAGDDGRLDAITFKDGKVQRAYLGTGSVHAAATPHAANCTVSKERVMKHVNLLIGEREITAADGRTFDRIDPFTGDIATRAAAASVADAIAAAEAAAAAFPAWAIPITPPPAY